jgi:Flp pilus assembly protein TadG
MNLRRRRRPAGRASSRGQSLVEFALVFPIFILLLAGMIDFGIGLYSYMTINNAARDAARLGSTMCSANPCSGAVAARATAASSGLGITTTITCNKVNPDGSKGAAVNCASGTAGKGDQVTVQIDYSYRMIWPLGFGTQIPMTASMTLLVE